MKKYIIKFLKKLFGMFGITVLKTQTFIKINSINNSKINNLQEKNNDLLERGEEISLLNAEIARLSASASANYKYKLDIELLDSIKKNRIIQTIELLKESKSQINQDLFVLNELDFKTNGYFVEFGATNGIDLSNSYLLERNFGWSGILAEPARCWHDSLLHNRSALISKLCVWKKSGENLIFSESKEAEYSTITGFERNDLNESRRLDNIQYTVNSITLNDLLAENNAPEIIDYLSIDTEGTEFEILKIVDFDKYIFRVITCEHNYTAQRELVHALLTSKGYQRKYEELSLWDDWYVRAV